MNIEEHECTIGMWSDYDNTHLVTLNELKEEIVRNNESYEYRKENNIPIGIIKLDLNMYCDGRKSSNLYRFKFCPYCGEKIDWKKLKEAD